MTALSISFDTPKEPSIPVKKIRRLSIPASEALLSRYKVLVFDCYGTLIDWERGMYENLQPMFTQKICPEPPRVFELLSAEELRLQNGNPDMIYPAVLEACYKRVCADLRIHLDEEAAVEFGQSVGRWPAFPDSSLALSKLKDIGLILVVLSNVDNASFEETRTQLEAGWEFDAVCTAEDNLIEHRFGIDPSEVLSVAQSKTHDVEPAQKMGLKAVWINRPEAILGSPDDIAIAPDWEYPSMQEFAAAMERANGRIGL